MHLHATHGVIHVHVHVGLFLTSSLPIIHLLKSFQVTVVDFEKNSTQRRNIVVIKMQLFLNHF